MHEFDNWLRQAQDEHVDDAAAVVARLNEGRQLAADPSQLTRLAHLGHHLYGEHLGDWNAGVDWLLELAQHPHFATQDQARAALGVYLSSLALSGGHDDGAQALPVADRIRAAALAAGNLASRDTPRATALFKQALREAAQAQTDGLPNDGPHVRALAVSSNNLACTLEEKLLRTTEERELMILAAQSARRYWALAGGWLEIERAEYRLAHSYLQAGDPVQARHHAQLCLELVQVNAAPPLEHFFGWEAMGLAERAAGSVGGAYDRALAQARAAFEALAPADRESCKNSLDELEKARA